MLDAIAAQHQREMDSCPVLSLRRALVTAATIERLEGLLTPSIMAKFMRLMNTPSGFMTDRPNQKKNLPAYPVETVKRCIIDGLLKGILPFNNEMNIIADRLMVVQAGWRRKLHEVPGIGSIEPIVGIPMMKEGRTLVNVAIRWRLNGVPQELRNQKGEAGRTYAVPSNEWASADALQGKALRRGLRDAYEFITSVRLDEGEIEACEAVAPELPQAGRHVLGKKEKESATNGNGASHPAAETPQQQTPSTEAAPVESAKEENLQEGEIPQEEAAQEESGGNDSPITIDQDGNFGDFKESIAQATDPTRLAEIAALIGKSTADSSITQGHAITLGQLVDAKRQQLTAQAAKAGGKGKRDKSWQE